jgi:hypothetical protein
MRTHALALVLGSALLASTSFAEDEPEAKPPQVVLVDYAAIPTGTLPSAPAEGSAPKSAPKARVTDLKLDPVADNGSVKRPRKHVSKKHKKAVRPKADRTVEVHPSAPSLALLYAPGDNSGEIDGDPVQRRVCGNQGEPEALRWEKLSIASDGSARLQIDDVWFDSKSCSLWPGANSSVALQPIAWSDGKPWLYAVRGDSSVTFVMPRSNDMAAETMVGTPLTIRGGFTRVTMPVGRWGSASMLAALSTLRLDPNADDEGSPIELSVELVQTMSERFPTLLVQTRAPVQPVARGFE